MSELLRCRHMMRNYNVRSWHEYRELPPELVSFFLEADGMEGEIIKASAKDQ